MAIKVDADFRNKFKPVQRKYRHPHFSIERKLAFWEKCGYRPSPAQLEYHKSTARFVSMVCAARFGKTLAEGAELAYGMTMPDFRAWCVGPQYNLAVKELEVACNFLAAYRMKSGKRLIDLCRRNMATRGQNRIELTTTGSFIETKSTDNIESLLGASLDKICLSEGANINLSIWERYLRPRLGDRLGRCSIPSTPNGDSGILREFYNNGLDPEETDWQTFQYSIYDNPYFSREEIERARHELPADVFAEQYLGQFRSRLGLVFDFNEKNVFDEYNERIHSMPAIIGVRYKENNPVVASLIKVDVANGAYRVVDEFEEERAEMKKVADWIQGKREKHVIRLYVTESREKAVSGELKRYNIPVTTNVAEEKFSMKQGYSKRIRMLRRMIDQNEILGHPRLLVYKKCQKTIDAFSKATWPKKREGTEQTEIPLDDNMYIPRTVSLAIARSENIQGRNIYTA